MGRFICTIIIAAIAYSVGKENGYYEGFADANMKNPNRYEEERTAKRDRYRQQPE